MDQIVGNADIWSEMTDQIRKNACPHIVLCGPAGCGKSMFLREVFDDTFPVLTVDCTANAGLRDLRDTIRGFARGSKSPAGNYRWIVFEHADSLSADTQAFLRRMMETTAANTRFLFECSDAGAISEPILSRSMLYTVMAPTPAELRYEVARRSGFTLGDDVIAAIEVLSGGNMRTAVAYACAAMEGGALDICGEYREYLELLKGRPSATATAKGSSLNAWIRWSIEADVECRNRGLDCRILLAIGWPNHPDVSYMKQQWSRLGGISTRALFFRTVEKIARMCA